jgi:hypothetical protein
MAKNDSMIPSGWFVAGNNPEHYEFGKDDKIVHSGSVSAYITSKEKEPAGFGTLMQDFDAKKYRGKRIQVSSFMKTDDVKGWSAMWMKVEGYGREQLAFDNMFNRKIVGTTDWTEYSIVLDVAEDAKFIAFGMLLSGAGKVWMDDSSFTEVSKETPLTIVPPHYPTEPTNLDFEK